nr:MAG TPA: hypothetical protein [Caudoviricetes sp.]
MPFGLVVKPLFKPSIRGLSKDSLFNSHVIQ